MAGDGWAAIGAGFTQLSNLFAQKLITNMDEKRALAHAEAVQKIKLADEERAFAREQNTPVERKVYQGSADQGPPLLMVDAVNKFGESVKQVEASPREKQEFAARSQQDQDAKRIAEEERSFKARPEFKDGFWVDRKAGTAVPEQGYLDQQVRERAAGRTQVNVAPADRNQNAFQDALGKADADLYSGQRNQAIASQQALNSIDALDSILSGTKTGKLNEVYGKVAQWAGLPEGTDFQTTDALVQERVNELLKAQVGPQTDKDAARAFAQVPNMGTDPAARKVIFDYLRKKAKTSIQLFDEMDTYAGEKGSLKGFKPTVGKLTLDTSPLGKSGEKPTDGQYAIGKVVDVGGKKYKVIPGGTPDDPNLEEI